MRLIALLAACLAQASAVQGATFECMFLQDKYRTGKPNKASCAMFPEYVYGGYELYPEAGRAL